MKTTTLWDEFKKIEQRIRRAVGNELEAYRDSGAILLRATCEAQHDRGRRTPPQRLDEGVLAEITRRLGIERAALAERARLGTAEDQDIAAHAANSRSLREIQVDLPTIAAALAEVWRDLYGDAPEPAADGDGEQQPEGSDSEDWTLFNYPIPVLYKELEDKIDASARHQRWADRDRAAARRIAEVIEKRTGDVIDVDARIAEAMGALA